MLNSRAIRYHTELATILQDLMANLNQEASPADTKALQKSVDVLTRQLVSECLG